MVRGTTSSGDKLQTLCLWRHRHQKNVTIIPMTKLSININKFALLRNARNQDTPNLISIAKKCINFGCNGITVHPRPDERHIRYDDLQPLNTLIKQYTHIEFNIEGYPSDDFVNRITAISPDQVTLVPDPPEALTSSYGWDLQKYQTQLTDLIQHFKAYSIRCSLFIDPSLTQLEHLLQLQPDRVELYTYDYNDHYHNNKKAAILPYCHVVDWLTTHTTIGINAGHDLNLDNLQYLLQTLPAIQEVSIGHQFVCDCLDFGLEQTMRRYLELLPNSLPKTA